MSTSKHSMPQPPLYNVTAPGSTTAPYPAQPGVPTGMVGPGYPAPPPGHPQSGVPVSNAAGGYPSYAAGGMVIVPSLAVGPESCTVVCPACHKTVLTDIKVVPTTKTHYCAIFLAFVGCCLCSWVPYCVDSMKTTQHYCPECKAFIADYDR